MIVNLEYKEVQRRLKHWNHEHGLGMATDGFTTTGPRDFDFSSAWTVGNCYLYVMTEGKDKTAIRLGVIHEAEPANDLAIRAWDKLEKLLQPFAVEDAVDEPQATMAYQRLTFKEAKWSLERAIIKSGLTEGQDYTANHVGDTQVYNFFQDGWLYNRIMLYRVSEVGPSGRRDTWGVSERWVWPTADENRERLQRHKESILRLPYSEWDKHRELPYFADKCNEFSHILYQEWEEAAAAKGKPTLPAKNTQSERVTGADVLVTGFYGPVRDMTGNMLAQATKPLRDALADTVRHVTGLDEESFERAWARYDKQGDVPPELPEELHELWRDTRLQREAARLSVAWEKADVPSGQEAIGVRARRLGIRVARLERWDKIRLTYFPNGLTQEQIADEEEVSVEAIRKDFKHMRNHGLLPPAKSTPKSTP